MNYNQQSLEFWRKNWRKNIVPVSMEYPEGSLIISLVKEAVGRGTVRDIGCGPGRLTSLFYADKYRGYDVSEGAIQAARMQNPLHVFDVWDFQEMLPADVTLLYIVMLHVDDNDLAPFCELISKNTKRIIIGDMMKRSLHFVTKQPLCFGRNQNDYLKIFAPLGFHKAYSVESLHPIYQHDLTLLILENGEK